MALAQSQQAIGLPVIAAQVAELRAKVDDIDLAAAAANEKGLRYDKARHGYSFSLRAHTRRQRQRKISEPHGSRW